MPVQIHAEIPRPDERAEITRAIRDVLQDRDGDWFASILEPAHSPEWRLRVEGPGVNYAETFLGPDEQTATYIAARLRQSIAADPMLVQEFTISGFGPFAATTIILDPLTVLVGSNGTGKTSLLELLRAIRHFVQSEIPAEIIPGWESRDVYHRPGPDRLGWRIISRAADEVFSFEATIIGPPGVPVIGAEYLEVRDANHRLIAQLRREREQGWIHDAGPGERRITGIRHNQLAFRSYVNPTDRVLNRLKEQIESWRFFSGIRFADGQIRQPALIESSPVLRDDGGNLASVLNWLQSEHPEIFQDLELQIRGVIPGFRALAVKPTGAGRVTLTWNEEGLVNPLTAADLSDGSLRLLLWLTLTLVPNPPALVCIDEPEVGLHPRTLPKIAALLEKLSARTQVIVATHSSYLLAQFDVAAIGILRKQHGTIEFTKPASSKALRESLREFGADELELMHRSNELEALT